MREAFDFDPFLDAQAGMYDNVLAELRDGRKVGHWIWFVFPQLAALGRSGTARFYGLADADEAAAYLAHAVLGARLVECCELLLAVENRSAHDILGSPDDLKLRSSMTLFLAADPPHPAFERVLQKYHGGVRDPLTTTLLSTPSGAR